MQTRQILAGINEEDHLVPQAIAKAIDSIQVAVDQIAAKMKNGGRLFYLGAGTSGRLGIVDASELPPTFGANPNWVVGLIAGGDGAIRTAVEFAEDDEDGAWRDLEVYSPNANDVILGIAASGTTPYVIGGLKKARQEGISTACIVCNANSPVAKEADFPIEIIVGPEFITGSTRMKAGTAQKLVLNMISTAVMVKLGRVKGNKMVDMQMNNNKLVERAVRMLMQELSIEAEEAKTLIEKHGSVRKAMEKFKA